MRYLTVLIIIMVLLMMSLSDVLAWRHGRPHRQVTPYGDLCPRCNEYGICKSPMSHDDAKKAMLDYYHKKGLAVELVRKRGRFIRAKIKDKEETVDVIIFDRRTGRIRSIY